MAKRHPDIRKYYIFRALLKRFILPVLVVYAIDRGLSLEQIALIAGVGTIASFLFEVPSGAIADAIGHRRALVFSMIGQAASMTLYLGGTFEWILAGSVMYFVAGTFMTGTSEALFYERVKALGLEAQHGKLYGQGKGFATAVSVVSMALAGIFYEILWYLPFLVGVVQYVVAAYIISTFGPAKETVSVAKKEGILTFFSHFSSAAGQIWQNRKAFWLIIVSALIIGPLFGLGDFQQAIMSDLGMAATYIGLVYAGKRLLSIGVQGYIHKIADTLGAPRLTLLSAGLMTAHLVLVGMVRNPALILLPLMVGSIAWVGLEVATNDYLNKLLDTKSRATALSMNNMVRLVAQLGTLAIFGTLAATTNAAQAYGAIGVVLVVVIIYPMFKLFQAYR